MSNLGTITKLIGYNQIGDKGNIIDNQTLNSEDEVIFNIRDYRTSLISYEDSSISLTTPISIYGARENNINKWVYIGILYPTKFINSVETVRSVKGIFDLTFFNYIKIKNNSEDTYSNVICSIFSY